MMIEIPASLVLFIALLMGTFSGGMFMYFAKDAEVPLDIGVFLSVVVFLAACIIGGIGYRALI